MAAAVDAARSDLLATVQPGVVTDHEQSLAAGQRVTAARYALFAAAQQLYPARYPPPPAGDGADVFRAADEGGEGTCTRKEIAKYLMRNQALRHRLREGWASFNSHFGTEDIAENHEELSQAEFCRLWQEAAALREDGAAAASPADAVQLKLSSVQPMRSQLHAMRAVLAESEWVDVHGLGNAINMLSTCVEILRGEGLLAIDRVQTFFPDGIRNSLGDPVPKMVVRVRRAADFAARLDAAQRAAPHGDGEWEDAAAPECAGTSSGDEPEDSAPRGLNPLAKEYPTTKDAKDAAKDAGGSPPLSATAPEWKPAAMNPTAAEYVPMAERKGAEKGKEKSAAQQKAAAAAQYQQWMHASQQIGWANYYPSAVPSEGAQRWREEEWWRREAERLQQTARARSRCPIEYEALLAPRTRIEDAAVREHLRDLRKEGGAAHRTASDLLGLAGARGALGATEAEVDGLARIFGNPKGDRRGREWTFTAPDLPVKVVCVAVHNVVRGVQDGRDERAREDQRRADAAAEAAAGGRGVLASLRLLAELAREDGNPPRAAAAARARAASPRRGGDAAADDADADDADDDAARPGRGRYDREHWTPLLNLLGGDVEPITNRARLPPPPPPAPGGEPRRPNKGFAYIEFSAEAGAEKALALDSYPLQGKALKVSPRHTELVGALAVEHGRRFYLSRCEAPKYRDDRAWVSNTY